MMNWLLLILKILGILIVAVLGIVLLALLLVLFVPVRYRGRICYGPQPLSVSAGISWMLFVLRIRISYLEQQLVVAATVFGIPVYRSDKERKEPKVKKAKKKS